MTVIVDVRIPAESFELGQILDIDRDATVALEKLVPLGEANVPFVWVQNSGREVFLEHVRAHDLVNDCKEVQIDGSRALYALDWDSSSDKVLRGISAVDGHILDATAINGVWDFKFRFFDHGEFASFETYCATNDIPLKIVRIYNRTKPESGPYFGLTEPQRETLSLAVTDGYYAIPRERSTKELGAALGISDQAVTERLRRAIVTLVENTIIAAENSDKEQE